MSNALHNSIKEKHLFYKLSLSDMNYLPIYKRYRNILPDALRKAKSIHYSYIVTNLNPVPGTQNQHGRL